MSILESPVYKHNKVIKEETDRFIHEHIDFLTEYFLKTCFYPVTDYHYVPDWIQCNFRLRLGTESYCMNIFHPKSSKYLIYVPICDKSECCLDKIF